MTKLRRKALLLRSSFFILHSSSKKSTKVIKVWALPRSLATTNGIIGYFLFLRVLRCFSSPAYRSPGLYIQPGATGLDPSRVSPFGHLRIKRYVALPRSLSQLITSFIGILRQGILCARLSNFLRLQPPHRISLPSSKAGRTAAACRHPAASKMRCSLIVPKYGSLRCSLFPCMASVCECCLCN